MKAAGVPSVKPQMNLPLVTRFSVPYLIEVQITPPQLIAV